MTPKEDCILSPGTDVWDCILSPGTYIWDRILSPGTDVWDPILSPGTDVWDRILIPGTDVWDCILSPRMFETAFSVPARMFETEGKRPNIYKLWLESLQTFLNNFIGSTSMPLGSHPLEIRSFKKIENSKLFRRLSFWGFDFSWIHCFKKSGNFP